MSNNNQNIQDISFTDSFSNTQQNLYEYSANNISNCENVFDAILAKLNICHDRVFAPWKITNKVKNFEKQQNAYNNEENNDFNHMYYPNNEDPTIEQKEEEPELDNNIDTVDKTYEYFYKNLSKTESEHIQNIEKELDIDFLNIETAIQKIKKRLLIKWEELNNTERKVKKSCMIYDKNFKMIKNMKETIGDQYSDLNNNLNTYINDIIKKNNMNDDIKNYKILIMECNFLKTCVSKYHNIQVMKKNTPICKICYINKSDYCIIPCGHLICNTCLILAKTFAPSPTFNIAISDPITYSVTLFNTNNNGHSRTLNLVPGQQFNITTQNENNTENQTSRTTQTQQTSTQNEQNLTSQNEQNLTSQTEETITTNLFSNLLNSAGNQPQNVTFQSEIQNIGNRNQSPATDSLSRRRQRENRGTDRRPIERRRATRRTVERQIPEHRANQRRNIPTRPKDKCPFCRQEIVNSYKIYF